MTELYTLQELSRLSVTRLRDIVREQGWPALSADSSKDELAEYIVRRQRGLIGNPLLPRAFSAGVVLGPIQHTVNLLQAYYEQKQAVMQELMELSDAALFAVVDSLGHNLVLANPYVMVNGLKMDDRAALIWYLVGLRSD